MHFKDDDYSQETSYGSSPLHQRLKKGVVPSVFSWTDEPSPQDHARGQRVMNRGIKRKLLVELDAVANTESDDNLHTVPDIGLNVEICDDETGEVLQENETKSDISVPTTFTSSTQTPAHPMFNIYNFIDDDAGIHFYTGLENYFRFLFVL